jgi:DNA-binding LacI/PurR family transcriptional regulator
MADVARLAGVSHQTVSRVLNSHPNVKPQTRDSVLAAIAELGYRPNAAARTLVTRRTRTLGVVSFDTTLYGPASMLYGIERAAAHSYFVSIASLPALDRRSVLGAVDRFLDQGVEGMIVIAPTTAAVAACSRVRAHAPLVALGCGTHAPLTSAAVDNAAGAALATRYLLGLGHRTVHHIAGPASWLDAQERISGWREALAEAGRRSRNCSPATGAAHRGTGSGSASPTVPRSPRCSAGTTTWRSGCCGRSRNTGGGCPATSAWWGSTTYRNRPLPPPLTTSPDLASR